MPSKALWICTVCENNNDKDRKNFLGTKNKKTKLANSSENIKINVP
jgi:hypothetical protein